MSNISTEALSQFFVDNGQDLAKILKTECNFLSVKTAENACYLSKMTQQETLETIVSLQNKKVMIAMGFQMFC